MALVKCPNCGNEISDKALVCPHCQIVLKDENKIYCSECGTEIPEDSTTCPKCGNPIKAEAEVSKVEVTGFSKPNIKINKKVVIAVIAVVALCIGGFFISNANKANTFKSNYKSAVSAMLSGASNSEYVAGLIHDTWRNSIYKEADPKTNKYTLRDRYKDDSYYQNKTYLSASYFNDDFNDSLRNLLRDPAVSLRISDIKLNQETVQGYMSDMANVPKGYENAYAALDALYTQYLGITKLAVDPSGSLQSYTSSFNSYDDGFVNAYEKATSFSKSY